MNLTLKQIDGLSAIAKKGKVGRSSDKTKAAYRFKNLLKERIGECEKEAEEVLNCPDINAAVDLLQKIIMGRGDKKDFRIPHLRYDGDARPEKQEEPKKEKPVEAAEKTKGGRQSLANKKIYLTGENYRKPGSKGWETIEIVKNNPGLTVEELEKKGGERKHILWDLKNFDDVITLERLKKGEA